MPAALPSRFVVTRLPNESLCLSRRPASGPQLPSQRGDRPIPPARPPRAPGRALAIKPHAPPDSTAEPMLPKPIHDRTEAILVRPNLTFDCTTAAIRSLVSVGEIKATEGASLILKRFEGLHVGSVVVARR